MHIFGTWEETRVLEENPRRHTENVETPHGQWPWPESIFLILFNIIMK